MKHAPDYPDMRPTKKELDIEAFEDALEVRIDGFRIQLIEELKGIRSGDEAIAAINRIMK